MVSGRASVTSVRDKEPSPPSQTRNRASSDIFTACVCVSAIHTQNNDHNFNPQHAVHTDRASFAWFRSI